MRTVSVRKADEACVPWQCMHPWGQAAYFMSTAGVMPPFGLMEPLFNDVRRDGVGKHLVGKHIPILAPRDEELP